MEILYEDKFLAAVLKPAGTVSQSDNVDDLISSLPYKAHIITRLDRPVGGIVLLAKDSKAAAKLSNMIQSGEIKKRYLAVTDGDCAESAELTDYIITDRRLNISKAVNKGTANAKQARLYYKKICCKGGKALLDVALYTGRHHQIRLQLANNGTPIAGDTKYNPQYKHKRGILPALFAYRLSLVHPVTGENIELKALPDYGFFKDFTEEINEL